MTYVWSIQQQRVAFSFQGWEAVVGLENRAHMTLMMVYDLFVCVYGHV